MKCEGMPAQGLEEKRVEEHVGEGKRERGERERECTHAGEEEREREHTHMGESPCPVLTVAS